MNGKHFLLYIVSFNKKYNAKKGISLQLITFF
jgi:hypothetical protein